MNSWQTGLTFGALFLAGLIGANVAQKIYAAWKRR